jgi:methionine aminotransferase
VQLALAGWLADESRWRGLPAFYQAKRDLFREGLARTRLVPLPCQGTYFQLASYAAVSDEPDTALAERLTREVGVASIPVSAFYAEPPRGEAGRLLRFCFAKGEETLREACARLERV